MPISIADIQAASQFSGVDISHVDLDAIQLPPGEDFGIHSDEEEQSIPEDAIKMVTGYRNIIFVDNLPEVMPDKRKKLDDLIGIIFNMFAVIKEGGFWMPEDPETGKTLGHCFIEYNTAQEAEFAREKTDGFRLEQRLIN